jgi:hypothetical protein
VAASKLGQTTDSILVAKHLFPFSTATSKLNSNNLKPIEIVENRAGSPNMAIKPHIGN